MDVDLIFRIAAVGILVAVLGQLLSRSGREAVSYTHLINSSPVRRASLRPMVVLPLPINCLLYTSRCV